MPMPVKTLARVEEIIPHQGGVYEVSLAVSPRHTRFLPGQFLHLALDEFDPAAGYWPESRVFSIASEPGGDSIRIVYSVKGRFTRRMEAELAVGREVWLKLPYGDFVVRGGGPGRRIVFLAGGTGVSPFIPYLSKGLREGFGVDIVLFYGARTPGQLLFLPLLRELRDSIPGFRLKLFLEEGEVEGFDCARGRLSAAEAFDAVGGPGSADFYVSGPPAMIAAFGVELARKGVGDKEIHYDDWE